MKTVENQKKELQENRMKVSELQKKVSVLLLYFYYAISLSFIM